MMIVYCVPVAQAGACWTLVAAFLARAIDCAHGELTLDDLRLMVERGRAELIVGEVDDEPIACLAVEYMDYPRLRVGNIIAFGAKAHQDYGLAWAEFKAWLRSERACQEVRAFTSPAVSRLLRRKFGAEEIYRVVRSTL